MKEIEPRPRQTFVVRCRKCDFTDETQKTYKEAENVAIDHHFETGCESVVVIETRGSATIHYGYSNWDFYKQMRDKKL
jgi:hypothetical protein